MNFMLHAEDSVVAMILDVIVGLGYHRSGLNYKPVSIS